MLRFELTGAALQAAGTENTGSHLTRSPVHPHLSCAVQKAQKMHVSCHKNWRIRRVKKAFMSGKLKCLDVLVKQVGFRAKPAYQSKR